MNSGSRQPLKGSGLPAEACGGALLAEEVRKLRASSLVGTKVSALALAFTVGAVSPAFATSTSGPVAAARAEAARINLVSSDLPGWTQSPNVDTSSDDAMNARVASCAGAPDLVKDDVADISSPYFDQGNTEVTSDVAVVRDRADAMEDLAGMKGSKMLPCLRQLAMPYVKAQLPKGTTVSAFKIGFLAPDWVPPYSFGYRITVVVSVKTASGTTVTEDLVTDEYGFLVGVTELEVSASHFAAGAFAAPSPALEQRLVRLVQSRADRYASTD